MSRVRNMVPIVLGESLEGGQLALHNRVEANCFLVVIGESAY